MSPLVMATIVFAGAFGGAMVGMFLRTRLPEHHLDSESKDVIRVGMGLIATMTALVLGLVTASAKSSYDMVGTAVRTAAADILVLDDLLARYGAETADIRELLKRTVARRIDAMSGAGGTTAMKPSLREAPTQIEDRILALAPGGDTQSWLKSQALAVSQDVLKTRWLSLAGAGHDVPLPFLAVLVFWLTAIFGSFGLFAPRTATVIAALFVCALSIAGAVFLILEMDTPLSGLMKVSDAPLRYALAHLGP